MQYGMNLLLWTDRLCDDALPVLDELKTIGFDAVELPIYDFDVESCSRWGRRLDALGLARSAATARGPDENPISADPAVRRKAVEANRRTLDCCAAAGCRVLVGPMHSALGVFTGRGPTEDEWKWAVEAMRDAAEHAATLGVVIALECLNRFECYLLNTAADGARFVADVGHPNCKMMYDTFHAHIEEKSTTEAILALKDCLVHVHISENDRSTPGTGSVRWDETFDALAEIGYDGLIVVEAFGTALERLTAATKIWRRMYQSERQLATDSLSFMKHQVAKRA